LRQRRCSQRSSVEKLVSLNCAIIPRDPHAVEHSASICHDATDVSCPAWPVTSHSGASIHAKTYSSDQDRSTYVGLLPDRLAACASQPPGVLPMTQRFVRY